MENEKNFVEIEKIETNNLLEKNPIVPKHGGECVVQVDTDSNYCCFEDYREYFPDIDDIQFFYHLETQMNNFWAKILDIKARKNKMPQLIIFNRENMFTHFFSFAKKMYMGDVVDSEGDQHWGKPKQKIQGIVLKRTEIPDFCKEKATDLCFSIMRGMSKEDAEKYIIDSYEEFKKQPIEMISANRGVHEYDAYAEKLEDLLKNGLNYKTGTPFNVKCAVNWNYICTKENMAFEPIMNNGKFKYIYVLPNNKYKVEAIGYVGKWPDKFNEIFEIDYETCFRKFFLPCPDDMFNGLKWKTEKELIPLKKNKFKKFFC